MDTNVSSSEETEEEGMDTNVSSSEEPEEEACIRNNEEVRIVLVGKTGAGKSATGNTILGFEAFHSELTAESLTNECKKAKGVVAGRNVYVVDTPGLFDTRFSQKNVIKEIKQCICFAAPGPHMFLVAIKVGRFTEEEQKTVEMIQEIFGKQSINYTMILFTHGDLLRGKSIEDFFKCGPKKLQELISKGHYHVFNNENNDPSQVTELLEKINNMVLKNDERSYYTTQMFQEAERLIEGKKQKILKMNARKIHKEEEKLKKQSAGDVAKLEIALEMLKEIYIQEAREQAEKKNKFLKYGVASGAAAGAVCGAYTGVYVGGLVFGPVGVAVGGVLGAVFGGIAGGATGAGTANPQAVEVGARAVKIMKDNCVTH